MPDGLFELGKCLECDVEMRLQVRAHLELHLVDLPESELTLTGNKPRLVGVSVIADDLGSNHKCRDEEAVPRGTACGDEPLLQSPQEVESGKGDGGCESGAMEGVCDEMGEVRSVRQRGWRLLIRAMESVVDVTRTNLGDVPMAVEGVGLRERVRKGTRVRREGGRTFRPDLHGGGWGV